jgi:hypothetical protein
LHQHHPDAFHHCSIFSRSVIREKSTKALCLHRLLQSL